MKPVTKCRIALALAILAMALVLVKDYIPKPGFGLTAAMQELADF